MSNPSSQDIKNGLRTQLLSQSQDYFRAAFSKEEFIAGRSYIPVTTKVLEADDLAALVDSCLDLWLTAGRFTREFEAALPTYFARKAGSLLVNSGSSANLLAVSSLAAPMMKQAKLRPLEPGDEIITAAAGFPTTVNPILQVGCTPVFVDVDLKTLNATVESIQAARTPKTRAVVLAHTLGNPYRSDLLAEWCRTEELYLVEDCCDAFGSEINGAPVGSFGDYATLSFYPAHHITMGEGGAVIPRTAQLKRIAESMRDWGRDCWCEPGKDNTCGKRFEWQMGGLPCGYDHKYIYSNIGYNLKATDMQAAIGLTQLKKVRGFIEARRQNWKALYDGVKSSPNLREKLFPVEATESTNPSWFGFAMHCAPGISREKIVNYLENHKVGTRNLFGGNLTKQPAYQNVNYRVHSTLQNTDTIMSQTFWIGVHPALNKEKINYMLQTLEEALKQF